MNPVDTPAAPETDETSPHLELAEEVRESTFVCIPAYNEGPVLADVIRDVTAHYPNVVVVDDGSRDETFEVARSVTRHALRHPINRGQGAALQTAIDYALLEGARYVVTFDADGQHRVADIPVLLEPLVSGECDIALGSRFLGETIDLPFVRLVTLKLAVLFTRFFSRVRLTDTHNGFRAFTRRAAKKIGLTCDRMAHASEVIDQVRQSGYAFVERPVQIRYTERSLAKGQSSGQALKVAADYLLGRMIR